MASLCGADLAVSAISGDAPLRSLCATAGQLVVTTPAKLAQVVSWVVGAGRGSGWVGWLAGCAACFTCPQAELISCLLLSAGAAGGPADAAHAGGAAAGGLGGGCRGRHSGRFLGSPRCSAGGGAAAHVPMHDPAAAPSCSVCNPFLSSPLSF